MVPAKKGDLATLKVSRSVTVLHGGTTHSDEWMPVIVTKVSKEGRVREAVTKLGITTADPKDRLTWLVVRDSDLKGKKPREVLALLEHSYDDIGELRDAMRAAIQGGK
jgi:hypothetical protein